MKYRVRADLIFETTLEGTKVFNTIKTYPNLLEKIRNLAQEHSFIEIEECHHDETPSRPCVILQRIEK